VAVSGGFHRGCIPRSGASLSVSTLAGCSCGRISECPDASHPLAGTRDPSPGAAKARRLLRQEHDGWVAGRVRQHRGLTLPPPGRPSPSRPDRGVAAFGFLMAAFRGGPGLVAEARCRPILFGEIFERLRDFLSRPKKIWAAPKIFEPSGKFRNGSRNFGAGQKTLEPPEKAWSRCKKFWSRSKISGTDPRSLDQIQEAQTGSKKVWSHPESFGAALKLLGTDLRISGRFLKVWGGPKSSGAVLEEKTPSISPKRVRRPGTPARTKAGARGPEPLPLQRRTASRSSGHFPRFFGTCTFTWWVEEAPAVSVQAIVIV